MKVMSTEQEYGMVATGAKNILNEAEKLPENVFLRQFKFFLFITFDELFLPLFFNHLKQYMLEFNEKVCWVTAIDPDPRLYYGANFNFFGSVEFTSSDTVDDYLAALNDYPKDSPADALAHNANLLVFFSPTNEWAVYGDRDADIAICAFADRRRMDSFRSFYGSDLLGGVKAAAGYAYGAAGKSALEARFCGSYSGD